MHAERTGWREPLTDASVKTTLEYTAMALDAKLRLDLIAREANLVTFKDGPYTEARVKFNDALTQEEADDIAPHAASADPAKLKQILALRLQVKQQILTLFSKDASLLASFSDPAQQPPAIIKSRNRVRELFKQSKARLKKNRQVVILARIYQQIAARYGDLFDARNSGSLKSNHRLRNARSPILDPSDTFLGRYGDCGTGGNWFCYVVEVVAGTESNRRQPSQVCYPR